MSKYYFITYQAKNLQGDVSVWNDVTDLNPMEFIINARNEEKKYRNLYRDFVVINTLEITFDEYSLYNGSF